MDADGKNALSKARRNCPASVDHAGAYRSGMRYDGIVHISRFPIEWNGDQIGGGISGKFPDLSGEAERTRAVDGGHP